MRISDWSSDVCSSDLDMIVFSPRRVTLPPNQPQVLRVGVRVPEGLPPGDYRAHMLFRAVPDVVPAVAAEAKLAGAGVTIALTPIYGITIPAIAPDGDHGAAAAIGTAGLSVGREIGKPPSRDTVRNSVSIQV